MASKLPRRHFDEDIARAEAMLELAEAQENAGADERLYQDARLSAIALAVGALDSFLCDLYVDCLTAVLRAYRNGNWPGDLPSHFARRKLPAGEVLDRSRPDRPLWSIRMAASSIMESDNMLRISRLKKSFNGILPDRHKLWRGFVDRLAAHGHRRLTTYKKRELEKFSGSKLGAARKEAAATVRKRLGKIIQLRHDWIHNCGRPKQAIKTLTHQQAEMRVRHVRYFATDFDDHIQQHRKV